MILFTKQITYNIYIYIECIIQMNIETQDGSSPKSNKAVKQTSQTNSLSQQQQINPDNDNNCLDNLKNTPKQKQNKYQRERERDREKERGGILNIGAARRSSQTQLSVSPRKYLKKDLDDEESSSRVDSIGPSNGSTIYDQAVSRYQCIATLTQEQNKNLKSQNVYLLEKLRKMQDREAKVRKLYDKAKKYKALWQQAQMQIQVLKDECQIYKQQADEMKKIILNDVNRLKEKVKQVGMGQQKQRENMHVVEQTAQRSKKSQIRSQTSTQSTLSLTKYLKPYPECA